MWFRVGLVGMTWSKFLEFVGITDKIMQIWQILPWVYGDVNNFAVWHMPLHIVPADFCIPAPKFRKLIEDSPDVCAQMACSMPGNQGTGFGHLLF